MQLGRYVSKVQIKHSVLKIEKEGREKKKYRNGILYQNCSDQLREKNLPVIKNLRNF